MCYTTDVRPDREDTIPIVFNKKRYVRSKNFLGTIEMHPLFFTTYPCLILFFTYE